MSMIKVRYIAVAYAGFFNGGSFSDVTSHCDDARIQLQFVQRY